MTIRLLIADDHQVFRSGLSALLSREKDLLVVAEAGTGPEVLEQLEQCETDVLILDLSMPGGLSGPQIAETALERYPRLRILVLTMHEDPYYLSEMFRVGVRGFLLKKAGAEDVVKALRAVARGEYHVDAALGGQAMSALVTPATSQRESRLAMLTPRERDVCRLLALGYTNVEVGQQLFISDRTVESHRTSIMTKLSLKNRAELVRFALDNELVK